VAVATRGSKDTQQEAVGKKRTSGVLIGL